MRPGQLLEVITVGIPFCSFKLISGIALNQQWLFLFGAIDLVINVLNFISLLLIKRRIFDACFLSFIVRVIKRPLSDSLYKWQDLGNALDVFLSFILVSTMIGFGHLNSLSALESSLWNISVIFNVIGAGLSRLSGSILEIRSP